MSDGNLNSAPAGSDNLVIQEVLGRVGCITINRPRALNALTLDWAAAGFKDTLLRCQMKREVANGDEKKIQPGVQA